MTQNVPCFCAATGHTSELGYIGYVAVLCQQLEFSLFYGYRILFKKLE
jgi:hypothetical protein